MSSSTKTSYLFRPSKLLIQPPKLIFDDLDDSADTVGSFHSTGSGYDSVTTLFRKSPVSVSEFDSVSQVGYNKHLSGASRISPNALVSARNYRPSTYETFYGVSSELKSDQRTSVAGTSEIEASALPSARQRQICLCSLAFFILGFFFQQLMCNLRF